MEECIFIFSTNGGWDERDYLRGGNEICSVGETG